jgi:hypothetical protein
MGSSMLKDAKPPLATAGGCGACRDILGGGAHPVLWVRWAILCQIAGPLSQFFWPLTPSFMWYVDALFYVSGGAVKPRK